MSSIEKVELVVTGGNASPDDCENASNEPKTSSPLQQLKENERQPQRHHPPRIVKSASQGSSQPGLQHTGTPEHMRGATKDMFDLIERAQCSRLDDQRCVLPAYFSQLPF